MENNEKNSSYGCENANQSIGCTVTECRYHCERANFCSLSKIDVVTHETNPTKIECTDCASFELK